MEFYIYIKELNCTQLSNNIPLAAGHALFSASTARLKFPDLKLFASHPNSSGRGLPGSAAVTCLALAMTLFISNLSKAIPCPRVRTTQVVTRQLPRAHAMHRDGLGHTLQDFTGSNTSWRLSVAEPKEDNIRLHSLQSKTAQDRHKLCFKLAVALDASRISTAEAHQCLWQSFNNRAAYLANSTMKHGLKQACCLLPAACSLPHGSHGCP